jgi:hypothetical protein
MPMYVYHARGHAVGFMFSSFIHDLQGNPVGRVMGSHVYRLDGTYVGEFFKETVVDKPVHFTRHTLPVNGAKKMAPVPYTSPRRGVVDYGYADTFHLLADVSPAAMAEEEALQMAAE